MCDDVCMHNMYVFMAYVYACRKVSGQFVSARSSCRRGFSSRDVTVSSSLAPGALWATSSLFHFVETKAFCVVCTMYLGCCTVLGVHVHV
jgi:hypothetical protein